MSNASDDLLRLERYKDLTLSPKSTHAVREGAMALDEQITTGAIADRLQNKSLHSLDIDAAIVGGGPAGPVAGYYLASWE